MVEIYADDKLRPATGRLNANVYVGPVLCAFIVLLALLCLYLHRPPAPIPADAPATDFSAGRAIQQLREIAREAHPVGTIAQTQVRDYIVGQLQGLALTPQVQEATSVGQARATSLRAGTVKNILARLPGATHDKGVLLVAHYDSVPAGPGASDDGSGVVALLETARALKAGPPLRNDVIFLFSDAEEVGLLGARAFVDEHPWAKEVGMVLNFEARGNRGPSAMFETSDGNGALIGEFAKSAPYPSATSISYEIYKLLPNDTDLTVFKKAGLPGLNFAFIDGLVHYHSATDNLAAVDEGSVQHQGSYALALARHFGNLDLTNMRQGNAVYFDLLGTAIVRYPTAWILPIAALVLLVFAAVLVIGRRTRLLRVSGVLIGFFAFLLNIIVVAVAATLAWRGVLITNGGYRSLLFGDTYNSGIYMLAFATLTLSLTSVLHTWYRRKVSVENLAIGALVWWLILLVATSVLVPGASYLFAWPLLFSLFALGADFLLRGRQVPARRAAVLTAGAIPGIVLMVPLIYMIFVALTLNMAGGVMILLVLLLGLLTPQLALLTTTHKWLLPGVTAAAFVCLLVAGNLTGGFSREHPKQDSIFYGLNADTSQAVWASADASPDAWTSQFLTANRRTGALADYFPGSPRSFLQADAPAVALVAPQVVVLSDARNGEIRTLRLRVSSPRRATVMTINVSAEAQVVGGEVGGRPLLMQPMSGGRADSPWSLQYYALPPEGIELSLQVRSSKPVDVRAVDQSYGLPPLPDTSPRPEQFIASPFPFISDSTFVSKSYKF
ncbi:MAG: hypothetical protein QOG23_5746 [Blastocatellia bacterium]|jgi:hypothetical protein|nr:hypothetical protein [Blastocatellia bacterium]